MAPPQRRESFPGLPIATDVNADSWIHAGFCGRPAIKRSNPRPRRVLDHHGDAGLALAVQQNIDRVKPWSFEFQLLDVHDVIARAEVRIAGQDHFHGNIDAGHDGPSVGIDKVQAQLVRAFVLVAERHAQRDGALGMHGGQLLGVNGVEGAEQIQLAIVIRGRIAQHRNLNVHPGTIRHEFCKLARTSFPSQPAREQIETTAQGELT